MELNFMFAGFKSYSDVRLCFEGYDSLNFFICHFSIINSIEVGFDIEL